MATTSTAPALALALATLTLGAGCKDDAKAKHDAATGDGAVADAPGPDGRPLPDAALATCTPQSGTTVVAEPYLDGLVEPVMLAYARGDARQFVIEQDGRVRVIEDGALVATPYLDITDRVNADGSEQGLLGIAFHPDFRTNDRFYLHYTGLDGAHVVAEYKANPGTNTAAPASVRELLRFADPFSNHNGGSLEIGNDGKLYIAIGDGGAGGDPGDRAQDDTSLFGKILRIDVDARTGDKPYGIPADNPFASSADGAADPRPEIWHKGLRNPFRFTFDRATGDIYIGDVGQGPNPVNLEEIDVSANLPGINWGWDDREGNRRRGKIPNEASPLRIVTSQNQYYVNSTTRSSGRARPGPGCSARRRVFCHGRRMALIRRFEGLHCGITITRPTPTTVVVAITGRDVGEHGNQPLDVLDAELERGPYALFIDGRKVLGAAVDVSNVWAQWLRSRRDRLDRIHMLTGSRFVQLTADFVRRFAELGDAMLIYTDGAAFDDALRGHAPA